MSAIQGWGILIPPVAIIGGIVPSLLIDAVAGLYPAVRVANVSPTEALPTL